MPESSVIGSDAEMEIFSNPQAQHRPQHLLIVAASLPEATHPGLIELPSALAKRWRGAAKHRPVARRRGKTWCRRGSGDDDAGRNNRRTKHSSVVYCAAPTVSQIESRLHRWVVPTPVWPRRRAERAALLGPTDEARRLPLKVV